MKKERRLIVVTGGTRGIGAAIAEAFLAEGAEVVITGTNPKAPKAWRHRYYQLDLMDLESVARFAGVLRDLGRVDVLVNNAGINVIRDIDRLTPEEFERVHHVNVRGPLILSQAVISGMKKRRNGRIINIASIWSVASKAGRTAYSTAKSGVAGMTRALAVELGPYDILVNSVSPGFTMTRLTRRSLGARERREISSSIPLGRIAKPSEIAEIVSFLASTRNSYLTGQNLIVDGGYTIA